MTLDGRIDWTGGDPSIVHLTDNGTRKVQIRLASGKWHSRHSDRLEIAVVVADVDTLIRELELARTWVKDGADDHAEFTEDLRRPYRREPI